MIRHLLVVSLLFLVIPGSRAQTLGLLDQFDVGTEVRDWVDVPGTPWTLAIAGYRLHVLERNESGAFIAIRDSSDHISGTRLQLSLDGTLILAHDQTVGAWHHLTASGQLFRLDKATGELMAYTGSITTSGSDSRVWMNPTGSHVYSMRMQPYNILRSELTIHPITAEGIGPAQSTIVMKRGMPLPMHDRAGFYLYQQGSITRYTFDETTGAPVDGGVVTLSLFSGFVAHGYSSTGNHFWLLVGNTLRAFVRSSTGAIEQRAQATVSGVSNANSEARFITDPEAGHIRLLRDGVERRYRFANNAITLVSTTEVTRTWPDFSAPASVQNTRFVISLSDRDEAWYAAPGRLSRIGYSSRLYPIGDIDLEGEPAGYHWQNDTTAVIWHRSMPETTQLRILRSEIHRDGRHLSTSEQIIPWPDGIVPTFTGRLPILRVEADGALRVRFANQGIIRYSGGTWQTLWRGEGPSDAILRQDTLYVATATRAWIVVGSDTIATFTPTTSGFSGELESVQWFDHGEFGFSLIRYFMNPTGYVNSQRHWLIETSWNDVDEWHLRENGWFDQVHQVYMHPHLMDPYFPYPYAVSEEHTWGYLYTTVTKAYYGYSNFHKLNPEYIPQVWTLAGERVGKIWGTTRDEQFRHVPVILSIVANISVEDAEPVERPTSVRIESSYPNPFNPSTEIRFTMDAGRPIRLAVYDMLGREVAELANGMWSAGTHTVRFDASGLSSGVYLIRLSTPTGSDTRRVMLIR